MVLSYICLLVLVSFIFFLVLLSWTAKLHLICSCSFNCLRKRILSNILYFFHLFLCLVSWNRDGTSIILSDDVGQLYILSTGQGESQKDAEYDQVLKRVDDFNFNVFSFETLIVSLLQILQFFLGDYRPLIRDTHGNVVDQVRIVLFLRFCMLML